MKISFITASLGIWFTFPVISFTFEKFIGPRLYPLNDLFYTNDVEILKELSFTYDDFTYYFLGSYFLFVLLEVDLIFSTFLGVALLVLILLISTTFTTFFSYFFYTFLFPKDKEFNSG